MNCPNCGQAAEFVRDMRFDRKRYKCNFCGIKYQTKRQKNKHKETIIESADSQKHTCIVCGREFWGKPERATCSRKCSGKLTSSKHIKYPRPTPTSTIEDYNKAFREAAKQGHFLTYAEFQRGDY